MLGFGCPRILRLFCITMHLSIWKCILCFTQNQGHKKLPNNSHMTSFGMSVPGQTFRFQKLALILDSNIISWHCKLRSKVFNSGPKPNNILIGLKTLQKRLLQLPMLSLHYRRNLCCSEEKICNCLKIHLQTTS